MENNMFNVEENIRRDKERYISSQSTDLGIKITNNIQNYLRYNDKNYLNIRYYLNDNSSNLHYDPKDKCVYLYNIICTTISQKIKEYLEDRDLLKVLLERELKYTSEQFSRNFVAELIGDIECLTQYNSSENVELTVKELDGEKLASFMQSIVSPEDDDASICVKLSEKIIELLKKFKYNELLDKIFNSINNGHFPDIDYLSKLLQVVKF